jgi:hypothetical protein
MYFINNSRLDHSKNDISLKLERIGAIYEGSS